MPVMYETCQKCARMYISGATCDRCGTTAARTQTAPPSSPRPSTTPEPVRPAVAQQPVFSQEHLEPVADTPSRPSPSLPSMEPHAVHALAFHGSGGSFLGIHLINILFTILTLGIYHFWARVKVRRYLYSESEFKGDRFAYHGTGRELWLGSMRAGMIFGGVSLLFKSAPLLPGGMAVKIGVLLVGYLLLFLLIPVAIAATRRYRLSRSSWRGIRFSFRGSIAEFVRLYLKGIGLSILTFGFHYPSFIANQQQFLVSHSYFGDSRFGFDGKGSDLRRMYLFWFVLYWLALILVAGLGLLASQRIRLGSEGKFLVPLVFVIIPIAVTRWFWFQADKQRYVWNHTTFGPARFRATMTGGQLCLLKLGNALLLVLSLGLAWPWVMVRNVNFTFRHLSLEGAVDLASVQQEAQSATAFGEGLDSLMDMDPGLAA